MLLYQNIQKTYENVIRNVLTKNIILSKSLGMKFEDLIIICKYPYP